MIVKTGANYQAEGGYIEASKKDAGAIVNINGVENEILDMSGKPASIVTVNIKKPASLRSSINFHCVYDVAGQLTTGNYGTGEGETDANVLLFGGVLTMLTLNPSIPIKAGAETHNCEIITIANRYYLRITGPDPVIVFEEAN